MSESQSALESARLLAQARIALDDALAAIIESIPEDERSEFGDADEVSGFALTRAFASSPYSFPSGIGYSALGGERAIFDRNVYCAAPDLQSNLTRYGQP